MNPKEKEDMIIDMYNQSFNEEEKWSIFMNDGFCPLDDNGYPKNMEDIVLSPKYEMWKYQTYMYKILMEAIKIKHTDNSSSEKILLDIGCGKAGGISFYNDYYKFKKIVGIDLNLNHINFAKNYINNVDFFCASAINMPLESNYFDIVTSVETCAYYDPFENFVEELYRILKYDGIYVRASRLLNDEIFFLNNGFKKINFLDIESNARMSCSISKWKFLDKSQILSEIFYNDETLYTRGLSNYNVSAFKKVK